MQSGNVFEVLPHGQVVVEGRRVCEKTETPTSLDLVRRRTEQRDLSMVRIEKAGCDSQEGRLAGGGCADFSEYKRCCGVIEGLARAERELLDLTKQIDDD